MAAIREIEKMENLPNFESFTSAKNSILLLNNEYKNAESALKAKIFAKDYLNRTKPYGGDIFLVKLRHGRDVMPCEVEYISKTENLTFLDTERGYYDVTCPYFVKGIFELEATLLMPCEVAYLLTIDTLNKMGKILLTNTTILNSKSEKEYSICAMEFEDMR